MNVGTARCYKYQRLVPVYHMIFHLLNATVILLPLFSPMIFILFTSILCILDYAPLARDLGKELWCFCSLNKTWFIPFLTSPRSSPASQHRDCSGFPLGTLKITAAVDVFGVSTLQHYERGKDICNHMRDLIISGTAGVVFWKEWKQIGNWETSWILERALKSSKNERKNEEMMRS